MRPLPFSNEMASPAARWRVEPVTQAHAPALERCLGAPEVAAGFGLLRPLTAGEVPGRVARFVEDRALGAGFAFALADSAGGEPVGACHVGVVGRAPLEGQLGYFIARPCWGRGLATELVQRVVEIAFEEIAFERLEALARVENAASLRLLARLGFEVVAGASEPWCRHVELTRHRWEQGR